MKERAPWPPHRSRAKERWRPRALMYELEVEVPTRTGVGGGGRCRNATGTTEGCNPRCQISEIRNSPGFAYKANPNSVGTPLLSDDGAVMFASLLLAGHSARWARKVSHGAIVSSHVLLYLRLLPL